MKVKGIEKGIYYIVKVEESFDFTIFGEVKDVVETAMDIGHTNICFDLRECYYISSYSLGLIANIHTKCRKNGGIVMIIQSSSDDVKEMISNSLLDTRIDVCSDEDDIPSLLYSA